ncbi:MAG TPA: OmpA family protein [Stellaceae bacterium]
MNNRLLVPAMILAALALAVLPATMAQAADWSGPEIGVQGGYGWGSTSGALKGPPSVPYHFNPTGAIGGAHAGYNWQSGPFVFGIEGDADGSYQFKSFQDPAPNVAVDDRIYFDASLRGKAGLSFDRFLAYGTAGGALADVSTRYSVGPLTWSPARSIRFGWTAGAGIDYAVTNNWAIGVEYRYTDLSSHSVANAVFADTNQLTYNAVRAALTYRFAPPPPSPPMAEPAPMPAAAPAMAPPPQARTFLVFFDFDKYALTQDARRVIEAAAASYKANGAARIDVAGYTDLAGTQAYNLRLSQRRADAVSADLAAQGVPRRALDVKWFGKEHPRVPTPDGVREPQNRRVEIVMP